MVKIKNTNLFYNAFPKGIAVVGEAEQKNIYQKIPKSYGLWEDTC